MLQEFAQFDQPVNQSQLTFRALLKCMAEPGSVIDLSELALPVNAEPNETTEHSQLYATTWCIAQTLFDPDSSVFLAAPFDVESLRTTLRFQTDTHITSDTEQADFVIAQLEELKHLEQFKVGTAETPDQSTTLILQVEDFASANPMQLQGPGIKASARLPIKGLTSEMQQNLVQNHLLYPCGIDVIFCSPTQIAALPRSTQILTDREGISPCM